MKFLKWLGIIILVLIIVYFLGPNPSTPKYAKELPAIPSNPAGLEKFIRDQEGTASIKTG